MLKKLSARQSASPQVDAEQATIIRLSWVVRTWKYPQPFRNTSNADVDTDVEQSTTIGLQASTDEILGCGFILSRADIETNPRGRPDCRAVFHAHAPPQRFPSANHALAKHKAIKKKPPPLPQQNRSCRPWWINLLYHMYVCVLTPICSKRQSAPFGISWAHHPGSRQTGTSSTYRCPIRQDILVDQSSRSDSVCPNP